MKHVTARHHHSGSFIMETTTFDLILRYDKVVTDEEAVAVFEALAVEISDVEFEYDFDYDFKGKNEDGFLFKVYVDTECEDEAYEVMRDKFEQDVPEHIEIDLPLSQARLL